MLFLLVPLHNLTDLNRLLSNNIATALYLGCLLYTSPSPRD